MSTSDEKRGSRTRRRPRVALVVEDDDGCRDEVRGVLQSAGYAVLEAADGEQALQVLLSDQKPEPTVIVLDMWLPRMSGQELMRVLRNYHRLARIPLVLTSASHVFADYAGAKNAGWLPKPFDAEALLAEVSRRCGGEPPSSPVASSAS
jgi:CheY-like chemotaxis protein